jgi:hypothetical protein
MAVFLRKLPGNKIIDNTVTIANNYHVLMLAAARAAGKSIHPQSFKALIIFSSFNAYNKIRYE